MLCKHGALFCSSLQGRLTTPLPKAQRGIFPVAPSVANAGWAFTRVPPLTRATARKALLLRPESEDAIACGRVQDPGTTFQAATEVRSHLLSAMWGPSNTALQDPVGVALQGLFQGYWGPEPFACNDVLDSPMLMLDRSLGK